MKQDQSQTKIMQGKKCDVKTARHLDGLPEEALSEDLPVDEV